MGLPQTKSALTPAEYLAFERASDIKHEYYDGELYAMAGETASHGRIKTNLVGELRQRLRTRNCDVFTSDMKVRITPDGPYVYPNVVIVCGEPVFHDETEDMLVNPHTIIEVLSASTQSFDRSGKFDLYQRIESLTTYVLVAQQHPQVTVLTRQARQHWDLRLITDLTEDVKLDRLRCRIPLAEIYSRVKLSSAEQMVSPVKAAKPTRRRTRKA